jgi:hypothetical protein
MAQTGEERQPASPMPQPYSRPYAQERGKGRGWYSPYGAGFVRLWRQEPGQKRMLCDGAAYCRMKRLRWLLVAAGGLEAWAL